MRTPKHLKFTKIENKGKALLVNKNIKKNEIVLPLKFDLIKKRSEASGTSIQIGNDKFLDSKVKKHRYIADYINHSCNPNIKIDFKSLNFVALKAIKKGEEITWNYLTTEYDLIRDDLDFDCYCGSKNCLKKIRGFKFLNKFQMMKLKPFLSPFLRHKV